jgi:hypothetical protein
MTQRRGPSSPGSPDTATTPQKTGTNPDGRTPVDLPTDTRDKKESPEPKKTKADVGFTHQGKIPDEFSD